MPMSFAICRLSFVIEHAQLPAFSRSPRQSNPPTHSMRRYYPPLVGAERGTAYCLPG
jgi:hypothetical protein